MSYLPFFCLSLVVVLGKLVSPPAAAEELRRSTRQTWKKAEDLSLEERQRLNFSTKTPRHPKIPYLPARPYPYSPPYTAEEMGFRHMEFTSRPRWPSVMTRLWATIGSEGILHWKGSATNFLSYWPEDGAKGELFLRPGEEIFRVLSQNTFPPALEGQQRVTIRYRTDKGFFKKEEQYLYSTEKRKVRRNPPRRRQDPFPQAGAFTPDDRHGRDAWEFSWRILGTDTLYETVRFPNTRPTITFQDGESRQFQKRRVEELKLMGDSYQHYDEKGGVECYVVESKARPDWIPNYYVPRILYWLEKYSFFPLRIEKYTSDGKIHNIEVRMAEMFNPALGERGYGSLITLFWNTSEDLMTYLINDGHHLRTWTPREQKVFFSPDFMRREWRLDFSVKTLAQLTSPEQYFLRPKLEAGKFPEERQIVLSKDIMARVKAQEDAGRLIFDW